MTKYTAKQASRAAARGAKWMDEHCPNWALEIDRHKLDLGRGDKCIWGQTAECLTDGEVESNRFSSFYQTAEALGYQSAPISPREFIYTNGFSLADSNAPLIAWEMLTIAWKMEILKRLGED